MARGHWQELERSAQCIISALLLRNMEQMCAAQGTQMLPYKEDSVAKNKMSMFPRKIWRTGSPTLSVCLGDPVCVPCLLWARHQWISLAGGIGLDPCGRAGARGPELLQGQPTLVLCALTRCW